MAELSRVRPDLNETEEQLLELQRAFLASQDHRANAAARVTRVGGAPPKEPSPENLAGVLPEDIRRAEAARAAVGPSATPTSHAELDSFGTGPAHGFDPTAEIREVVGEVIERAPRSRTGAPIPPTAPTAPGPGLAFPEAKHRTKGPFAERPKSKFMLERERKAAAARIEGRRLEREREAAARRAAAEEKWRFLIRGLLARVALRRMSRPDP